MGLERGERVVGDLRLGRRDPRDEGRLAHVRVADQGHVGHQGQLEVVPLLVALLPLLGEGRAPGGCWTGSWRCPGRPGPPSPASQRSPALARSHRRVPSARRARVPTGTGTSRSGPGLPVHLLAAAVAAVVGAPVGVVPERQQRRLVRGGHQPDVAAPAAVAAVGAALVDVGLAAHGDRAGPTVARLHVQLCLVDEAGHGDDPTDRGYAAPEGRRVEGGAGWRGGRCGVDDRRAAVDVDRRHGGGRQASTRTVARRRLDRRRHSERGGQVVVGAVADPQAGQELLHGLGDDVEDGRGELLDLVLGLGVLGLQPGEQAVHGLGRQGVVGHDGLVGHAEEGQQQGGQHAGAVLAGAAVHDRRQRVRAGQGVDGRGQHRTRLRTPSPRTGWPT